VKPTYKYGIELLKDLVYDKLIDSLSDNLDDCEAAIIHIKLIPSLEP
jgi:hypothetical protein